MKAKLQFEKQEMEAQKEAQKREMEMRIKLADLAAREALLEMEETDSILEQKCESNRLLILIKLLLRVLHNRSLQNIRQSRKNRW